MSLNPDSLRLDRLGAPEYLLIQLTEPRDGDMHAGVLNALSAAPGLPGFALATLDVTDWNADLSPWPAPPVFGGRGFAGGARQTLDALLALLPGLKAQWPGTRVVLGGYSLAGLFALWAACECDAFEGVNAASPSVWFPDWDAYADAHPLRARCAYLSLGLKEPKARNALMAAVGEAILRQQARLEAQGLPATLEWNPGNHFAEPDLRTAKGFNWLMKRMTEG